MKEKLEKIKIEQWIFRDQPKKRQKLNKKNGITFMNPKICGNKI